MVSVTLRAVLVPLDRDSVSKPPVAELVNFAQRPVVVACNLQTYELSFNFVFIPVKFLNPSATRPAPSARSNSYELLTNGRCIIQHASPPYLSFLGVQYFFEFRYTRALHNA